MIWLALTHALMAGMFATVAVDDRDSLPALIAAGFLAMSLAFACAS